jgi:flagellin
VNSENLRAQIGGLKVATRNAQDAISLVQTAEGAQTEVHSILQRMRDLVVQSGNLGTNDDQALKANQLEITELQNELNRISEQTQFGTKQILAGQRETADVVDGTVVGDETTFAQLAGRLNTDFALTGDQEIANLDDLKSVILTNSTTGAKTTAYEVFTDGTGQFAVPGDTLATSGWDQISAITDGESSFTFQVGANATQQVTVNIEGVSASNLGVDGINVEGADTAVIDAALRSLDQAISSVSENRATLGAFQNRMESTIRNVSVAVENLSAAESRIRDTDMAQEMVNFTRSQILQQAGTAMLAQANQVPQSVLSLLR